VTRLQAERPVFYFQQGYRRGLFLSSPRSGLLGAHPSSYPVGTVGSLPGGKQPEREAGHLPVSSAEINNAWS
jgi:hypothetical protein